MWSQWRNCQCGSWDWCLMFDLWSPINHRTASGMLKHHENENQNENENVDRDRDRGAKGKMNWDRFHRGRVIRPYGVVTRLLRMPWPTIGCGKGFIVQDRFAVSPFRHLTIESAPQIQLQHHSINCFSHNSFISCLWNSERCTQFQWRRRTTKFGWSDNTPFAPYQHNLLLHQRVVEHGCSGDRLWWADELMSWWIDELCGMGNGEWSLCQKLTRSM
jgi:hypothetical protein